MKYFLALKLKWFLHLEIMNEDRAWSRIDISIEVIVKQIRKVFDFPLFEGLFSGLNAKTKISMLNFKNLNKSFINPYSFESLIDRIVQKSPNVEKNAFRHHLYGWKNFQNHEIVPNRAEFFFDIQLLTYPKEHEKFIFWSLKSVSKYRMTTCNWGSWDFLKINVFSCLNVKFDFTSMSITAWTSLPSGTSACIRNMGHIFHPSSGPEKMLKNIRI